MRIQRLRKRAICKWIHREFVGADVAQVRHDAGVVTQQRLVLPGSGVPRRPPRPVCAAPPSPDRPSWQADIYLYHRWQKVGHHHRRSAARRAMGVV